jgi:hypothetical protein
MVEVNYVDSQGLVRRHIVKAWWLARAIAKNAVRANATQIRLRRIRVDIWLVDPETRTIYCAYEKVMLSQAARVSRDWCIDSESTGVLMMPAGAAMPPRFKSLGGIRR